MEASSDPRSRLFESLEAATRGETPALPGCVAAVWRDGSLLYHEAHGVLATEVRSAVRHVPVERETFYDLASLTKILCTTSIIALDASAGRVCVDDSLPEGLHGSFTRVPTVADVLEHASGLAAHREYFATTPEAVEAPGTVDAKEAIVAAVLATPTECAPRERATYSDLGFIILGRLIEELHDASLDRVFERLVSRPLRLEDDLHFRPPTAKGVFTRDVEQRYAPTEVYDPALHDSAPSWFQPRCTRPWADRPAPVLEPVIAHGEVHDDNAWAMGGVAGHAGLFGTAAGVLSLGRAWLDGTLPGLSLEQRERFWRPSRVPGSTRRLGFDGVSADGQGSTGTALSPHSVGHLGFTGTSLWIDPPHQSVYVLLSNRVHPTRQNDRIRSLRRDFHLLASAL